MTSLALKSAAFGVILGWRSAVKPSCVRNHRPGPLAVIDPDKGLHAIHDPSPRDGAAADGAVSVGANSDNRPGTKNSATGPFHQVVDMILAYSEGWSTCARGTGIGDLHPLAPGTDSAISSMGIPR